MALNRGKSQGLVQSKGRDMNEILVPVLCLIISFHESVLAAFHHSSLEDWDTFKNCCGVNSEPVLMGVAGSKWSSELKE
jgi:hypothetical protein